MAAPVRRRRQSPAMAPVNLARRLEWTYVDINDITPYPYNPRDNEAAIPAVAASIKAFGFLVPCVIDANNVLVAGHTRIEGAKLNGMTEVPCVRASYLTSAQIDAFRLIDNKVSEAAKWDFDLLSGEISKLSESLDFTQFGWNQEEIDCLSSVVAADCLDAPAVVEEESPEAQSRRSPQTARFVLGEVVFFIPATAYRNWVDGLRQLHDFNEDAIVTDLKRRLGIVE